MRLIIILLAVIVPTISFADPVNVALGKRASADMTHPTTSPGFAIDGDLKTSWNSGDYRGQLTIDLGAAYEIFRVRVFPNGLPCGVVYYNVYGSVNGSDWALIIKNANAFTAQDFSSIKWGDTSFANTPARFVRVVPTDWKKSWISYYEVEVYSDLDGENSGASGGSDKDKIGVVITWKSKSGNVWYASGPVQTLDYSDETTEEGAINFVKGNHKLTYIGSYGKYKVYKSDKKYQPGDSTRARKILTKDGINLGW